MAATTLSPVQLKIADEIWIATALLHQENPRAIDFGIREIVERARKEGLVRPFRRGVYVHVVQHCVANRPPNPGRYCMLFESARGRRRLFRRGDACHSGREGAKTAPTFEDIPPDYRYLLRWYREWSEAAARSSQQSDPLLNLSGSGRRLWSDEHADAYVHRLREGWR